MKLPDRNYTFEALFYDTRNPDNAPQWKELLYALATVAFMAVILWTL
ncbi:MAG TPA: hypothetical protein VKB76_02660 [Ktedonobacterales bacterium]|nr:hypothetical protein [Ktedonobacterales bacterium]